jgi:hypothetical protein
MAKLVNGSIITLKFLGHHFYIANQCLNARADNRSLGFVFDTTVKSTYWKVHQISNDIYQFENLATQASNLSLWLAADLETVAVGLSSDRDPETKETYWRVQQNSSGDYSFAAIGPSKTDPPLWLGCSSSDNPMNFTNWVDLVNRPMYWQVLQVPEAVISRPAPAAPTDLSCFFSLMLTRRHQAMPSVSEMRSIESSFFKPQHQAS